jgi:exopolysaccharide production protein ExoQ
MMNRALNQPPRQSTVPSPALGTVVASTAPAQQVSGLVRALIYVALLAALAHQCRAWVRAPYAFIDPDAHTGGDAMYGLYQKLVFLIDGLVIAYQMYRHGAASVLRVLLPISPLLIVGVLAAVFGFNPGVSFRELFYWLIMALTAAALSQTLEPNDLGRALLIAMLAILGVSAALAILLPANGTAMYNTEVVWRGLMTGKNDFGWVAALGLCIAAFPLATQPSSFSPALRLALAVVSIVCLFGSQSKTALATALAAIALWIIIRLGRSRMSIGVVVAFAVVGFIGIALLAALNIHGIETLLASMGRDLSFTGRDRVWAMYLPEILKSPYLGMGPGAFSAVSPITERLAHRLLEEGLIYTPHNMFLATLGDGGALGLAAKVGVMVFFIYQAMRFTGSTALGAVTIALFIGGMFETREVFGNGPTMFISILMLGAMLRTPATPRSVGRLTPP